MALIEQEVRWLDVYMAGFSDLVSSYFDPEVAGFSDI